MEPTSVQDILLEAARSLVRLRNIAYKDEPALQVKVSEYLGAIRLLEAAAFARGD